MNAIRKLGRALWLVIGTAIIIIGSAIIMALASGTASLQDLKDQATEQHHEQRHLDDGGYNGDGSRIVNP